MYRHTATITGRGTFPVDMLRYDSAYPATETDAHDVERTFFDMSNTPYRIKVAKRGTSKTDTFTAGRWQSFGATVETIESTRF
jgi:hypothetical protein